MPEYTTGEIAKLTGVSVRTVQYYDSRNILVPSAFSEGGRRLYSENDLKRLKLICFLREADISINSIGELLSGDDPGSVISVLIDQQEKLLNEEIEKRRSALSVIEGIRRALRDTEISSVDDIGDIASRMENHRKLKRLHIILLIWGIPVSILQWAGIFLWIFAGIWQVFLLWALTALPAGIGIALYYHRRTAYICPKCHAHFRPKFGEMLWANHTPTLRKLTCTECGSHGFCVEIFRNSDA